MSKHAISRRQFLVSSAAAGAALTLFPGRVLGANERVHLGIIGLGGKGGAHFKDFSALPNVEIIAVADPDENRMKQAGPNVAQHKDFRSLLDMKDVDAVVIATPDHWHCLAAIMAFQAGKHAYVEKPVSHCIWEGYKLVEAARKYDRIVQAGTQQRSCPAVQECAADVKAETLGKVLWVHCSRLDAREPIGKVDGPQPVPEGVDYNLWAGPAPMAPIMRKSFHYDWHWQWNWGTGEMGNWGVHYLDDLRHILGWDDVPGNAIAAGNRWWDDDGETPNMHMSLMEHRGVKVVVDIRNMQDPGGGGEQGAVYLSSRQGNHIQCENGFIRIARGGGKAYDKDGKSIKQYKGDGGGAHHGNFIEALRQGSSASLNAEIAVGNMSTIMCHLANVAWRVGQDASVEEVRESMKSHADAVDTLESMLAQLGRSEVDIAKKPFVLGPKLTFDVSRGTFTDDNAAKANELVRRVDREPFIVPEQV
ncbi:MAG TPA: Gfo/Idh/MocA family oxidoreductase [Candidatus Hydrogenedentes bacterium]|nr:Gfo/Idh/MocA family oxidoreductase [Candidatus Hydrogenedentota bacterium]HPG69681.1 Gfo/Idh/MocA family oxidoreductase [Candidatus Hydrogenedentota bacterium]